METVKILDKRERLDWKYDSEADVLYVSVGKPRKAIGVDIGQGVVIRYDEKKGEVVGLTILGVRQRVAESLAPQASDGRRSRRQRA
jgi:uncharacterized protein YuzE